MDDGDRMGVRCWVVVVLMDTASLRRAQRAGIFLAPQAKFLGPKPYFQGRLQGNAETSLPASGSPPGRATAGLCRRRAVGLSSASSSSCCWLLLMVRNYQKKGGHGGSRGGGLPQGFWDDQGGRAAAAITKAQRKAKAAAAKKTAVDGASARWKAMMGAPQSVQNAHSQQPEAGLRHSPRKAAVLSSSAESAVPFSVDAVANAAAASSSSEQL